MTVEAQASAAAVIPLAEARFHAGSFGDLAGRVFQWQGDLYRGVTTPWAPFVRRLFEMGTIPRLIGQSLLVPTTLARMSLEGYDLVLSHRLLPFASYPDEWAPAMLRDAALTILRLVQQLSEEGLTLIDGHPWNVLFDGTRPVWVDITSIIPMAGDAWPAEGEFRRYCLNPLLLMAGGHDRIARPMMCEEGGVTPEELALLGGRCGTVSSSRSVVRRVVPKGLRQLAKRWLRRGPAPAPAAAGAQRLAEMQRQLEQLQFPGTADSAPSPAATRRDAILRELLAQLRPASILHLGSDLGCLADPAAAPGARIVTFDTDIGAANQLYFTARASDAPVLPLVMDFRKPTPSRGLGQHWTIAAEQRLACDMVLALGAAHRLVFDGRLTFDHLAEGLAAFATRCAIVEFMPRENRDLDSMSTPRAPWYSLDGLAEALRHRFERVSVRPADSGRALLVCEK